MSSGLAWTHTIVMFAWSTFLFARVDNQWITCNWSFPVCLYWHIVARQYFWIKCDLDLVLCTPSSTQLGFELMASRSWEYILCHRDVHAGINSGHDGTRGTELLFLSLFLGACGQVDRVGLKIRRSGVWFPVLAMCRSVGQTSYSTLPRSTQP